ncbi:MAG: N-6 DNA methylase [Gaiellaceae bacterium]
MDPNDPRLTAQLDSRLVQPDFLGIAGVPRGIAGAAWLSELYLSSLPRASRVAYGRFYTPPRLAAILATRALDGPIPADGLIVDPACGGGSLLAAAIESIVGQNRPEIAIATVVERVRGTDTDPIATALCELALRIALLPAWACADEEARPDIPRLAHVADGLGDERPAAVVLANPPFGRCRVDDRQRLANRAVLYGHAHWPSLFLHAAVKRLVPGGVSAFVVPASLVGGAYYQRLREFLIEEAPPTWLAFVQERTNVFAGDVMQEALLASFRRGAAAADVEIERIGSVEDTTMQHVVSARSWRGRRPWLIARSADDLELVRLATKRICRIGDYGWRISTGPLVWNRHKDQLFDKPGTGRLPVVWASDIRDGCIDLASARPRRFMEPGSGQEWLILDRPAVLVQRTTAPEQPRRLVAAELDAVALEQAGGRVVVENHLNVCTWNGAGPLSPPKLVGYLMGDEADRLYRCMTGSVAVSAFELNELPFPDPIAFGGSVEEDEIAA